MMSTAKYKIFLREFIKLYTELPAVWKVKSKEYCDRQKKNDAYDILVAKYKELDENADREMVRKKINVLRTNFRRELSKIKSSQAAGEHYYFPSLWYFRDLEFLTEQEESEEGMPLKLQSEIKLDINNHERSPEIMVSDNLNSTRKTIKLPKCQPMRNVPHKRKLPKSKKIKELISLATEYLCQEEDDEAIIFSKTWAIEYKKLTPDQQLYAKKGIDDVLFEARLGLLQRNSVQINCHKKNPANVEMAHTSELLQHLSVPSDESSSVSNM